MVQRGQRGGQVSGGGHAHRPRLRRLLRGARPRGGAAGHLGRQGEGQQDQGQGGGQCRGDWKYFYTTDDSNFNFILSRVT